MPTVAEPAAEEMPAAEPLRVSVRPVDGAVVVAVAGELDMLGSGDFWSAAEAAATTAAGGTLVVDLTRVLFLDSHGLSALHRVAESVRPHGAALRVVVVPGGPARRAIELTGLHQVLPLCESLEEALEEALDSLSRP